MTQTYVKRLFDQYAGRYDAALTERLNYRGPALLREAIDAAERRSGRPVHFAAILDLGCGTGLAGVTFRPLADRLIGVDLSPAMIEQAKAKDLYDRLVRADLAEFLATKPRLAARYQLILAADVFVYVNDIAPIIAAAARLLPPDGLLAFTVETHSGDGAKLLPTLRYAYGEAYLRSAIASAGLTLLTLRSGCDPYRERRSGRRPRGGGAGLDRHARAR